MKRATIGSDPSRGGGSATRLRFDNFITDNKIPVAAVDQFEGYMVEVAVPSDWERVDPDTGTAAWLWRADPFAERFCANVVVTMSRVEAILDPPDVFDMLCELQVHLLAGTQEAARYLVPGDDGTGVSGTLAMRITNDLGSLDSVSLTRIITTQSVTLIAQLTLTALSDSPVDRANIGLTVIPDAPVAPVPMHRTTAQKGGTAASL